jgi:hypothetical protein
MFAGGKCNDESADGIPLLAMIFGAGRLKRLGENCRFTARRCPPWRPRFSGLWRATTRARTKRIGGVAHAGGESGVRRGNICLHNFRNRTVFSAFLFDPPFDFR